MIAANRFSEWITPLEGNELSRLAELSEGEGGVGCVQCVLPRAVTQNDSPRGQTGAPPPIAFIASRYENQERNNNCPSPQTMDYR